MLLWSIFSLQARKVVEPFIGLAPEREREREREREKGPFPVGASLLFPQMRFTFLSHSPFSFLDRRTQNTRCTSWRWHLSSSTPVWSRDQLFAFQVSKAKKITLVQTLPNRLLTSRFYALFCLDLCCFYCTWEFEIVSWSKLPPFSVTHTYSIRPD